MIVDRVRAVAPTFTEMGFAAKGCAAFTAPDSINLVGARGVGAAVQYVGGGADEVGQHVNCEL
jgi:hypothetical protein